MEHIIGTVQVDFDEKTPRIVKAINGEELKAWLDRTNRKWGLQRETLSI